MAVNSPGDALPCSIPQANAEKLQSIGAKSPASGVSSSTADNSGTPRRDTQTPGVRTVPLATNSPVGRLIDLQA